MRKPIKLSLVLFLAACSLQLVACSLSAQEKDELGFTLDIDSKYTITLPKIFKPGLDLSGRGSHRNSAWPQALAAPEALDIWQKEIGFSGVFRLQYNLWEIHELSKDKEAQEKLLANYENIIQKINGSGGTVILNIFGTPAGLGKVLDKKSPPQNLRAFAELVKNTMRRFSCEKKYNVWYEVWNAPDLDDFFLGRRQEYLMLYKAIAEAKSELEKETKAHIPLGGPSVSWWFQNIDGNTILTPERSLIYELIKFCYRYRLPLDFISWHTYSTDPATEKEETVYNKNAVNLIRDWLSYFHFDRQTPLIVDEWNYDRDANLLAERNEKSFIAASYIPSRLRNMHEAGIDYSAYFCLEDFQGNKEGVVRNTGVFSFDSERVEYKGAQKAGYNVFKMFNMLGDRFYIREINDEFTGVIATRSQDSIAVIIYNYIDPEIALNYLSRGISNLSGSERNVLLGIIQGGQLGRILSSGPDVLKLKTTGRVKNALKKAYELNRKAAKYSTVDRKLNLVIKNLKDAYLYARYTLDSSCSLNCGFIPCEEKEITAADSYQQLLTLKPYSVNLIVLKKKPKDAGDSKN